METNINKKSSLSSNITIIIGGAILTLIVLGFTSGFLPNWYKNRLAVINRVPNNSPSPIDSPLPSSKPKVSPETSGDYIPTTTKGGQALGQSTSKPVYTGSNIDFATLVYEYKTPEDGVWLIRASYDSRFEKKLDFDEVSPSYERKITVCTFVADKSSCTNQSVEPGIHELDNYLDGHKLSYEIIRDSHGPVYSFSPSYRSGSQTCVKIGAISDDISPTTKIKSFEKMDNNDWRDLHNEYCLDGNIGDKHTFSVKATDERGNTTENSLNFTIL